ncbi:hypothetical protein GCM10010297_40190 [Streptomyces malachitofuscus]|nr:hypothetical protein GCM10010297_40190 [Streptomyces malachitofuscus]
MSFGAQPRNGPHPDEPAEHEQYDGEEAAPLSVGLRLGVRVAVAWLLYVLPAALAPGVYGTRIAGPVSLGVVLAGAPLAVGVHALVVHGRRVDLFQTRPDARRWS